MPRERTERVPCPDVTFGADFLARLERSTARFAAGRERREGSGAHRLGGGGEEFVGYRPYRAGEDLRGLAWDLLARLDRPYVRVTQREASEHWVLLLDTSASMGVGPPGKLQAAAELAAALVSVGLRLGARIEITPSSGDAARVVRKLADLPGALTYLQSLHAAGQEGVGAALGRVRREAGRVIVIGDLLDLEPHAALSLRRPGRELAFAQVLAPHELAPAGGDVEWLDPEGDGRLARRMDPGALESYERALEDCLATWHDLTSRHGGRHCVIQSDAWFEDSLRRLLEVG